MQRKQCLRGSVQLRASSLRRSQAPAPVAIEGCVGLGTWKPRSRSCREKVPGPGHFLPCRPQPPSVASLTPLQLSCRERSALIRQKTKNLVCLKINDHSDCILLKRENEEDYCLKAYVFGFILPLMMDVQLFLFWVVLWVCLCFF